MVSVSAVVIAVSLGVLAYVGRAALAILQDLSVSNRDLAHTIQSALDDGEGSVKQQIRDLEDLVDRLPARWEEIKREAARLDARARYSVGRARKELSERGITDERLEDLGAELHLVDDEGSDEEAMPAVHPGLETGPDPSDWRQYARWRLSGGG